MRTVVENEEYNFNCDDVAAKQPITQRIPRITKMNLTTKRGLQNHIWYEKNQHISSSLLKLVCFRNILQTLLGEFIVSSHHFFSSIVEGSHYFWNDYYINIFLVPHTYTWEWTQLFRWNSPMTDTWKEIAIFWCNLEERFKDWLTTNKFALYSEFIFFGLIGLYLFWQLTIIMF